MKKKFEFGTTEKLFERIEKDKSGDLAYIVDALILKCKEASDSRHSYWMKWHQLVLWDGLWAKILHIAKLYEMIIERSKSNLKQ